MCGGADSKRKKERDGDDAPMKAGPCQRAAAAASTDASAIASSRRVAMGVRCVCVSLRRACWSRPPGGIEDRNTLPPRLLLARTRRKTRSRAQPTSPNALLSRPLHRRLATCDALQRDRAAAARRHLGSRVSMQRAKPHSIKARLALLRRRGTPMDWPALRVRWRMRFCCACRMRVIKPMRPLLNTPVFWLSITTRRATCILPVA